MTSAATSSAVDAPSAQQLTQLQTYRSSLWQNPAGALPKMAREVGFASCDCDHIQNASITNVCRLVHDDGDRRHATWSSTMQCGLQTDVAHTPFET